MAIDNSERKPVTLQDVARATGISLATASLAINGKGRVSPETREAVRRAARELGFRADPAARRLATGRQSDTIALFSLFLDLGVFTLKLQRLQAILIENGYTAPMYAYGEMVQDVHPDHVALLENLRRQRPLAIACNINGLGTLAIAEIERYMDEGGYVVCFDGEPIFDCDTVTFDRADNTYQAAQHLIELGHRDIGFFNAHQRRRLSGFTRALQDGGIEVREEWLFGGSHRQSVYEESGALLAEQFLRLRHRPTGICIVNDPAAVAFIAQVQQHGVRVPEDVSVVGHDGLSIGKWASAVPLTTVSQPIDLIAQSVANLLLDRLRHNYEGPARQIVVRGELIRRKSTAPPQRTFS